MKQVNLPFEIQQAFSHSLKIKGILQWVFARKEEHALIVIDPLSARGNRSHRRRTRPRGGVIAAYVLFAKGSDFRMVLQIRHIHVTGFREMLPNRNFFYLR